MQSRGRWTLSVVALVAMGALAPGEAMARHGGGKKGGGHGGGASPDWATMEKDAREHWKAEARQKLVRIESAGAAVVKKAGPRSVTCDQAIRVLYEGRMPGQVMRQGAAMHYEKVGRAWSLAKFTVEPEIVEAEAAKGPPPPPPPPAENVEAGFTRHLAEFGEEGDYAKFELSEVHVVGKPAFRWAEINDKMYPFYRFRGWFQGGQIDRRDPRRVEDYRCEIDALDAYLQDNGKWHLETMQVVCPPGPQRSRDKGVVQTCCKRIDAAPAAAPKRAKGRPAPPPEDY